MLTEFWVYLGSEICENSEYGRVLYMQTLYSILNMLDYALTEF